MKDDQVNVVIKCRRKRKLQSAKTAQKMDNTIQKSIPSKSITPSEAAELTRKELGIEDLDQFGECWRSVAFPMDDQITDDNAGGFTMLEEIDGVNVFYEDDLASGGKIVRFKRSAPIDVDNIKADSKVDKKAGDKVNMKADYKEDRKVDKKKAKNTKEEKRNIQKPVNETDKKVENELKEVEVKGMEAWERFGLDPLLVKGLHALKFHTPSEVQSKVLSMSLHKSRDVIAAAETGSGKTLAFGLVILNRLLAADKVTGEEGGLPALILSPTRELAVQIKDHLVAVAKFTKIKIVSILGGMSLEKQKRLISGKPDIVIGTPGRLWQWISEEDSQGFLNRLYDSCRFLVIDEADRMIEKGHFKELSLIFSRFQRPQIVQEWDPESFEVISGAKSEQCASSDDDDDGCNNGKTDNNDYSQMVALEQTFIFSATIKNLLDENNATDAKSSGLNKLVERVPMNKSESPLLIDLTTKQLVARTLVETRIDCLLEEKDLYLYYLLLRYPGRTLVFVNTIDCIKRLLTILQSLKIPVYGLHAQMQQRQRLKNLDRFKESGNCVLVASDVAARGLDIPLIDHVVHYQLPKTSELYVHRSGRTARASQDGLSILLCSPEELKSYKMICHVLKKSGGIPEFSVDHSLVKSLESRVLLSKQIAQLSHSTKKVRDEDRWMRQMAKEMDILDSSDDEDSQVEERGVGGGRKKSATVSGLKSELAQLMKTPVLPAGCGSSYITGKNSGMAERLFKNISNNELLPTIERKSAFETAKSKRK